MCRTAGLGYDPWQEYVLSSSLGERADGKWAAFEIGLTVPRQNGKDEIIVGRELVGLFLLEERTIVHTAHLFPTAVEHFNRLLQQIESTPEFDSRVQKVIRSHGEEGILLKGGQRILFKARTKGGGRGFTAELVILNEAMEIAESTIAALLPTLTAVPNPQIWYTGSAVDQLTHEHAKVFARVRERGVKGNDPSLAYFEWSAPGDLDTLTKADALDPHLHAQANPALGIRISHEYVRNEHATLSVRNFGVERLGIGDWPATSDEDIRVLGREEWRRCADVGSAIVGRLALAIDTTPDRAWTSISAAGLRVDGHSHVEVVEHRRGTDWVVSRTRQLKAEHKAAAVVLDGSGPVASLLAAFAAANIEVTVTSAKDMAQACGMFYDGVDQAALHHMDDPVLNAAVDGAKARTIGSSGAWAWDRVDSTVDISPLVACTLAEWGSATQAKPVKSRVINLNAI